MKSLLAALIVGTGLSLLAGCRTPEERAASHMDRAMRLMEKQMDAMEKQMDRMQDRMDRMDK
jgi:hypothetical protein